MDDDTEKYRSEFKDLFYVNIAKCEKLPREITGRTTSIILNSVSDNVSSNISNYVTSRENNVKSVQSAVKLGALQTLKFSGTYTELASSSDILITLIHKNKSLTDTQKLFYLRSSFTGDAELFIKCLRTTAINYQIVWDSLIARYDNKRVLV